MSAKKVSKTAAPGVVGRVMYDLFCGYGGAAKPFVDHGWRVVGFDNSRKCVGKYPGQLVLQDVATLDGHRLHGADLIWASPPCTAFSLAGRWAGNNPADGMPAVEEVARIIREARPKFWVVENVRGSVNHISALLGEPLNRGAQRNNGVWLWSNADPLLPLVRKNMRASDPRSRAIVPYPIADAVRYCIEGADE